MFYLSYLRSELLRRKGRTILTVAGLSIGVALVIVISSLTRGPRPRAEDGARPALEHRHRPDGDALAARPRTPRGGAFGGGGGGGFPGGGGGGAQPGADPGQRSRRSPTSRSSASPARTSSRTSSCPGTQLTFPQSQASQISKLTGVSAVSSGPRSLRRPPGGHGPEDRRQAEGRRPAADGHRPGSLPAHPGRAGQDPGLHPEAPGPQNGGTGGGRRRTPRVARRRRLAARRRRRADARAAAGRRLQPRRLREVPAARSCATSGARSRRPQQTIQQIVNPPQTNIKSSSYTIAGVDPSQPGIGLVTPVAPLERAASSPRGRRTRRSSPTPTRAGKG